MKIRATLAISIMLAGAAYLPASAPAQEPSLKDQLVGSWEIVSDDTIGPNGEKRPVFGEKLHGILIFSANGYFALVASDAARPQWKEKLRSQVTDAEYKTTALGLFAQSGKWSIDENSKMLIKVMTSAFNPANEEKTTKLPISLQGDELTITDPASPAAGGSAVEIYHRAK